MCDAYKNVLFPVYLLLRVLVAVILPLPLDCPSGAQRINVREEKSSKLFEVFVFIWDLKSLT